VKAHRSLPKLTDLSVNDRGCCGSSPMRPEPPARAIGAVDVTSAYGSWVVAARRIELAVLDAENARGLAVWLSVGSRPRDRQVLAYRYFAGLSKSDGRSRRCSCRHGEIENRPRPRQAANRMRQP
jgi:hypothetical protein